MINNNLLWLIDWYSDQSCNNLIHLNGIKIKNIDNPGWSIKINIQETDLKDKKFQEIRDDRSEKDWCFCKIEDGYFKANCGTFNVAEVFQAFRTWAEN